MKKIKVNAAIHCTAAYAEAQVCGKFCKKIYRGFSGVIITGWHRIREYETVLMLPVNEHRIRYEQQGEILNTSDNF